MPSVTGYDTGKTQYTSSFLLVLHAAENVGYCFPVALGEGATVLCFRFEAAAAYLNAGGKLLPKAAEFFGGGGRKAGHKNTLYL